jgi:predicted GNAT family acetyltransferase
MRQATAADLPRHCAWEANFGKDVHLAPAELDPTLIRKRVEYWLEKEALCDWVVDSEPVAQAAAIPIGPDGARIVGVYTPTALRGRGYAQALTAALTERTLASGRWCVLYTDAENEITNKIYPRVGYRLLAPYIDIQFAPAS